LNSYIGRYVALSGARFKPGSDRRRTLLDEP
jgi:hypothetical protein